MTLINDGSNHTFRFDRTGLENLHAMIGSFLSETLPGTEAKPLDPMDGPGWYEMDDRTWMEFTMLDGRLVGGRVAASWDEAEALMGKGGVMGDLYQRTIDPDAPLEDDDIDPVGGDEATATCTRSKTHYCEVRTIPDYYKGPRHEIGYIAANGQRRCVTGDWSSSREKSIARMRKYIADGEVMSR
jgi:hypothetical protein